MTEYYMGVDLGLHSDKTAIVVGHLDNHDQIRIDLVTTLQANVQNPMTIRMVVKIIREIDTEYSIAEGQFDTWCGIPFAQALEAVGLNNFICESDSETESDALSRENLSDFSLDDDVMDSLRRLISVIRRNHARRE
jgi:hypothetical protein